MLETGNISDFQESQNHTTYAKMDAPVSNQTSGLPSAYEYHVKTVAIIGGSNPLITLKDILNPSLTDTLPLYENHEDNHLRPRRSVNNSNTTFVNNTTAPTSESADDIISSSSNRLDNITSSSNISSSSLPAKEVTKRSFYPSLPLNHQHPTHPQSEMTQAIMEENAGSLEDHPSYHRRSFGHTSGGGGSVDDDEQHNIEEFFRKNVPIYDGVPIARRGYHGSSVGVSPKKFYHFSPSPQDEEGEEEEDGKPMKGLLEVHPNADMEYEYVPMKINEFGKQIVMEDEVGAEDEEADDQPSYPYRPSSNYHSGSYTDDDESGFYGKPAIPSNHPYPFENSYSSPFKSSPHHYHHTDYPSSSSYSDGSSTKYGTSHQYNSLADQQPRYYKHFKPSIPYPAHDEADYSSPSYSSYSSPSRPAEYSGRGAYHNNHDFVPKRAPSSGIRGSFASKYPTRSTHVPQTLEEYHRIHGTFDNYKKSGPRPYSRPIIVPQDDNKEEEEEEEKDKDTADYTRGPKSFVSLNFGTTGTSGEVDDEGVSVRHEIGHNFRPRKPYFRPAATTAADSPSKSYEDNQEFQVEYPAETVSGSTKYNDESSPQSIKAFVDSVFKQNNNYDPDIVVGKKSALVSPYNPHFGERVKQKTPEQNILWHRKGSSDGRVARDKQSRDKNDRLLHEENIKMYDSLVKEVTLKPAKRDADTANDPEHSQESEQEETPSPVPEETQPKQDQVKPEDDDEDEPQFTYWSQSTSEPN